MKPSVLHINTSADRGGAALAARRLHTALRATGHDSRMLVGTAEAEFEHIRTVRKPGLPGRVLYHAVNLTGLNYRGLPGARRIVQHPFFETADVVHLHNLHGGYFNPAALPALAARKPLVWTLHDMWALTGHCAYSLDCTRWLTGCGRCPYPRVYPPVRLDATRLECKLRLRTYRKTPLTVTCPSRWLAGLTRESMLGDRTIHHVPNGIDTSLYRPRDRNDARNTLGWPRERFAILFAAAQTHNPLKDFGTLLEALRQMPDALKQTCLLVVLGDDPPSREACGGIDLVGLGYVDSEDRKALVYSAADVLVHPTKADNHPLVLLEAMACGCPVVSTRVGGVPEVVEDERTGYLADAGDSAGLLAGVMKLHADGARRADMGAACRRAIVDRCSLDAHVNGMLRVYEEALHE